MLVSQQQISLFTTTSKNITAWS